jgi:magnesium-transporting ATPase (P-type)
MGNMNLNTKIEEIQKRLKLLETIIPILGLAVFILFCFNLYYDKTSLAFSGLTAPFAFIVCISIYMLQKMKKLKYPEMSEEELKKNSSSISIILAVNIVSIILLSLFLAYIFINPFGV